MENASNAMKNWRPKKCVPISLPKKRNNEKATKAETEKKKIQAKKGKQLKKT